MKKFFYPRLACSGIRKNRRLYLPYVLSCIGMVAMYYIICALGDSALLDGMKGGSDLRVILGLGKFVIAVFALLFLFYTNSFLTRRRYKEFGLYNVLGMDKRGISRVILWESLITAAQGLIGGILCGSILSKLAELGLLNAVHGEINFRFTVSWSAMGTAAGLFAAIFLLLTVKSLIQVRRARPLELLISESAGEKPPKGNLLLALAGLLLLGGAYAIAVSIKSPLSALTVFFIAVIMVIAATYLLFISGSVTLCRLLRKNKKYYYRKQHFVSVSTMAYRMKRNGAGLASICILATMVLVMLSSTASLFFGSEALMTARYPRGNEIRATVSSYGRLTDGTADGLRDLYERVFRDNGVTPRNVTEYRGISVAGLLDGDHLDTDASVDSGLLAYDRICLLSFISAADYNAATGSHLTLQDGETVIYPMRLRYRRPTITVDSVSFRVVDTLDEFPYVGSTVTLTVPTIMMVVPEYASLQILSDKTDTLGDPLLTCTYYYSYDLDADDETTIDVYEQVKTALVDLLSSEAPGDAAVIGFNGGCLAAERDDFYVTYGGLFFLGIMLSILFVFAAAVIIYYKQISEGYEDRARFTVMRKVGMTDRDIRRSINSQILTVFFAPLLTAGLHLAFAFPLIWKILQLFNLSDLSLVVWINIGVFAAFGVLYAILYKLTARAYYRIVTG